MSSRVILSPPPSKVTTGLLLVCSYPAFSHCGVMGVRHNIAVVAAEPNTPDDVLLIAADLDERRLMLAQLLEAGYRVAPVPGMAYANRWLYLSAPPPMILIDTFGDDAATPAAVEDLLGRCPESRFVLIVRAIDSQRWEVLRRQTAALLRRPISIDEVVDAVRRTLPLKRR
jgi:DNA-binding NtrC family response regulator